MGLFLGNEVTLFVAAFDMTYTGKQDQQSICLQAIITNDHD